MGEGVPSKNHIRTEPIFSNFRFILNLQGFCLAIFWLAHYCVSILTKFRVLLVLSVLNWALYFLFSDDKFSVFWVFHFLGIALSCVFNVDQF